MSISKQPGVNMWKIRAFIRTVIVEFKLYVREPQAAGWAFLFPVFLLVLFMFIWGRTPEYINFLMPGLVGITVASTAFYGIGLVLVAYRQYGYWKRLRTTPVPSSIFLGGVIVSRLGVILASSLLLFVVSVLLYGLRISNYLLFLTTLFFGGFTFSCLGILIAAMSTTAGSANAIASILFFPMMFLSGAFIPSSIFPSSLHIVSRCLPLTFFISNLRHSTGSESEWGSVTSNFLVLLIFLIASLVISIPRLKRMEVL